MNAQQIIRTLSPKRIAARVGVGENAVYNVKTHFPAGWYPDILDLCTEDGIDCPMSAFGFSRHKRAPEKTGAQS